MKNTAQVKVNLINQAQSMSPPTAGTVFMVGETLKGPLLDPSTLIHNKNQFKRLFGEENTNSDFSLICLQALETGAKLRISRVAGEMAKKAESGWCKAKSLEVTEPSTEEPSTEEPTSTEGPSEEPTSSEEPGPPTGTDDPLDGPVANLFRFISKGPGTYCNSFKAFVVIQTNELYQITIMDPDGYTETYDNIEIPKGGTVGPYNFLKDITNNSILVDVEYGNISHIDPEWVPTTGPLNFNGGTNAIATAKDYTDGFEAFDEYEDAFIICAPGVDEDLVPTITQRGTAYVESRKDLIFLQHLPNSLKGSTAIVNHINELTIDSPYLGIIGGGIKAVSPIYGPKEMVAMGPLLGNITQVHSLEGVWRSPTNYAAGKLRIANGVINNFGSGAKLGELDEIAQSGGNMVVNKGGSIMLWDFYSMDKEISPNQFLSVVLLQIYMVKVLKPILGEFLGRPNIFTTFQAIYQRVKPFLDSLINDNALFEYSWNGDQDVTSLDELQVNTPTELGQGKYRIQLQIKVVVPMVTVTLNIVMVENSVSFS